VADALGLNLGNVLKTGQGGKRHEMPCHHNLETYISMPIVLPVSWKMATC
jgi:hypothetical protein